VRRRGVVITGVRLVSPLGFTSEDFWVSALAGKPAIGSLTLFTDSGLPASCRIGGEVGNSGQKGWARAVSGNRPVASASLLCATYRKGWP
jgi:3-oxoacyl-[acyl-carrier-protein] synthase II